MSKKRQGYSRTELEQNLDEALLGRLKAMQVPDDCQHLLRTVRALFGIAYELAAAGDMPEVVLFEQFARARRKKPPLKKAKLAPSVWVMPLAKA